MLEKIIGFVVMIIVAKIVIAIMAFIASILIVALH